MDLRSGASGEVGDVVGFSFSAFEVGGPGDRDAGGRGVCPLGVGSGGKPPLPRPFKMLRVSLRR